MLSTLRLSHHIRRGKLARTWTTPKGHATPEAQPRQQARASRGKSPLARRVGAPTPQRNASEKRTRTPGTRQKKIKKFSRVLSSLIFPCGACEPKNLLDSQYHYDPEEYKKRVKDRQGWAMIEDDEQAE